jgi:hypothetical protein
VTSSSLDFKNDKFLKKTVTLGLGKAACSTLWKLKVTLDLTGAGAGVHLDHLAVHRTEEVGALAGAGVAVAVQVNIGVQIPVPEVAFHGHQDLVRGLAHAQAPARDMSLEVRHALVHLRVRRRVEAYHQIGWTPVITDVLSRRGYIYGKKWVEDEGCTICMQLLLEGDDFLFPPHPQLLGEGLPPVLDPGEVAELLERLRAHETAISVKAVPD